MSYCHSGKVFADTVQSFLVICSQVCIACLRAIRGLCVLEGVYLGEKKVIESPQYFMDESFMVRISTFKEAPKRIASK